MAVTTVARRRLPHATPPPPGFPLALHLWKHTCLPCCLCKCWTRRHTLMLSLAQSWKVDFWNFPPENLHFWGLSVLSPAYQ